MISSAFLALAFQVMMPVPPVMAPPPPAPPPMSPAETLARQAVRPPVPRQPLMSLFSADDYPQELLRKRGLRGLLSLRLTVADFGKIKRCVNNPAAEEDALMVATCNILARRSTFFPAVDASGRPTSGTIDVVIDWDAIFRRSGRG